MISEDQELIDVHRKLYESLFKESGRGAILIATAIVEEQLLKLIEVVLPPDITKNLSKNDSSGYHMWING